MLRPNSLANYKEKQPPLVSISAERCEGNIKITLLASLSDWELLLQERCDIHYHCDILERIRKGLAHFQKGAISL